jgi:hypothetical protein
MTYSDGRLHAESDLLKCGGYNRNMKWGMSQSGSSYKGMSAAYCGTLDLPHRPDVKRLREIRDRALEKVAKLNLP